MTILEEFDLELEKLRETGRELAFSDKYESSICRFGYEVKYLSDPERNISIIFTVPDWGNIRKFIGERTNEL